MRCPIDKITIKGFKSIRELVDFELKDINIFVGANGSGKSNFISFFKMLQAFMDGELSSYVTASGGAGDLLFNGRKVTKQMEFVIHSGQRGYRFTLLPTPQDGCVVEDGCAIENESRYYGGNRRWWELGDNSEGISKLAEEAKTSHKDAYYSKPVYDAVHSWQIYHFHDTGSTAGMRLPEIVQDNKQLRMNAENIAPFLLKLKTKHSCEYEKICNAVRLVIPFFEDFLLEPEEKGSSEKVNLSWTQKRSDYPMQPYHLSDGSIRFICLATALLQPTPPSTIIIDEPELGLHPHAIEILAELIQIASNETQVIVATQSPALLDQFSVEDIVIVKRKDGASTFKRLDEKDFSEWLENYSIGELWAKNVIMGDPSHE
jgi:predicted ATPase